MIKVKFGGSMNGKTILVIDDEKNLAKILKMNIELAGYNVVIAYDGEFDNAARMMDAAADIGVDAVILWDMGLLNLAKERGLTIKGAKQKIKENREDLDHSHEVIKKLQHIRSLLVRIRDEM